MHGNSETVAGEEGVSCRGGLGLGLFVVPGTKTPVVAAVSSTESMLGTRSTKPTAVSINMVALLTRAARVKFIWYI